MKILVVNAGSSSLKFQLFDMKDEKVIAKGNCEKIGLAGSFIGYTINGVKKEVKIGPGARVDGLDEVNKIVYELKPDNLNAINRGLKQLDRYLDILGDDWIGILLTYN